MSLTHWPPSGETVLRLDAWLLQPGGAWTAFLLGPFGRKVSVEARLVIACGPSWKVANLTHRQFSPKRFLSLSHI
jgi:hypothetical protein